MKKIFFLVLIVIISFMIIQTIRFNTKSKTVKNFEFENLKNEKVLLKDIFDKSETKYIFYILPECNSCIEKIKELKENKINQHSQLIVISVGLDNFNYEFFYESNYKKEDIVFLIDKKNTFYKNFGFGFTENFPTLVKYELSKNEYEKIY